MRYATTIQLEQVIIHTLGNSQSSGLELSERSIPLDDKQLLAKYFIDHIKNSLKEPKATAARFIAMDENITSGICKAILNESTSLVEGSQVLAKKLYDITKDDKRITTGDLAMAFYKAENRPEVPHYLAILKIDPSEVYHHKMRKDSEGKRYISLEIDGTAMPTTRERLQKCAFIQPLDPRPEYDMIVLDQQAGNETQQMAKFFVRDFLGADTAYDNQKRTKIFYTSAISALNTVRSTLQPHENEVLRDSITNAINLSHINIDTWVEELPLPEESRKQINQKISEVLPDREFDIDATVAKKLTRKQIFRGDNDLKIIVSAENYKDIIYSVELKDDPEKGSYYRIEIHTKKWQEVTR